MRIKSVAYYPLVMKLREPYNIAYESIDHAVNVFVRIETSGGAEGLGCAAPDPAVTGETPEAVIAGLEKISGTLLKDKDPLRIAGIQESLRKNIPELPSLRAAIDMALYDILGKAADLPLWKLLGGYRRRIRTSVTIGIMPPDAAIDRARHYVDEGFEILKLKGGQDVDADIERVLMVRKSVGPKVELRFDANQGYTVEQAITFVNAVRNAGLELLEQPTPKGKPEQLGSVKESVPVPVMADESLMDLGDVFHLAKHHLVDMINVKLMKVGGILEALHINSVARAADLRVMVGCMDESALSIAAGLHFALARPDVTYADLDGHLDLIGDPANGGFIITKGYMYPLERAGLGIELA